MCELAEFLWWWLLNVSMVLIAHLMRLRGCESHTTLQTPIKDRNRHRDIWLRKKTGKKLNIKNGVVIWGVNFPH